MKFSHKIVAFGLMVFITNCVSLTVNVYFPTAEIQEAAEEIEERVRTGQGAEGLQSSTGSAASNSPLHFHSGSAFGKPMLRMSISISKLPRSKKSSQPAPNGTRKLNRTWTRVFWAKG
jgi:hypothetical protein